MGLCSGSHRGSPRGRRPRTLGLAGTIANRLGALLVERVDPADLAGARAWYEKAAKAGHFGVMVNLGVLLVAR